MYATLYSDITHECSIPVSPYELRIIFLRNLACLQFVVGPSVTALQLRGVLARLQQYVRDNPLDWRPSVSMGIGYSAPNMTQVRLD